MNDRFTYDKPVTGQDFIGRSKEVELLVNLISSGESACIYDIPRSGKHSLILKALTTAGMTGEPMIIAKVSLMRSRTTEDVLLEFADGIIKACGNSPHEYSDIIANHLAGTHFVFDEDLFNSTGRVISSNWLLDEIDMGKVFMLPQAIATAKNIRITTVVDQFQRILVPEDNYALLKALESVVSSNAHNSPFIFTGSHFNGMKEIFDVQKWFWRSVVRIHPGHIESTAIAEYVNKIFRIQGKVIQKDWVISAAEQLDCHIWYIQHLFAIVDATTHGFVSTSNIEQARDVLLSIHRPRFYSAVCSLTDFQLNLLKAVLDGVKKFSSASVIDRYRLSSSANVKRLKDALIKKEIVYFNENDEPFIQDPLMEYWLRKEYFAE